MDLYQRLGVKRGASEAEIKKAYRSLAKQLHPDRNKDNPNAAKRFGEITQAYDLLSDKDKRARYDRGEIDEDGNPKMPFGAGFGGYSPGGGGGPRPGPGRRLRGLPGGFDAGDTADLSDLFEGLFGAATRRAAGGRAGFGGFRQRGRAPQKGADVAYRLKVPFVDAATLKPQRITLADGKTIDLKLPKGLEDGTKIRLAGKGQHGPGGRGDAIVTIRSRRTPSTRATATTSAWSLPVTLKEAVLGAKVKVPTPDGPVMLTIPKGTTSGKVLRLKGRGFTGKAGKRGDQLVTVEVDLPADDAELAAFAEELEGRRQPARAPRGLIRPTDEGHLSPVAGSPAQAAGAAWTRPSATRSSRS